MNQWHRNYRRRTLVARLNRPGADFCRVLYARGIPTYWEWDQW